MRGPSLFNVGARTNEGVAKNKVIGHGEKKFLVRGNFNSRASKIESPKLFSK